MPADGAIVRKYFARKLLFYAVTFMVAVTIDWLIPRFAPGDPGAHGGADGGPAGGG